MDSSTNQPQLPTGYTYDIINKRIIPSFSPVNPEDIEILSQKRLSICQECSLFTQQGACSICGCGMGYKATLIYPLDENGKAFYYVDPNGKYIYVCHLMKW